MGDLNSLEVEGQLGSHKLGSLVLLTLATRILENVLETLFP